MIFEQNQKKIPAQNFGRKKIGEKIIEEKILIFFLENEKNFEKNNSKFFFQLQVLYLAHILSKFQVVQTTATLS